MIAGKQLPTTGKLCRQLVFSTDLDRADLINVGCQVASLHQCKEEEDIRCCVARS